MKIPCCTGRYKTTLRNTLKFLKIISDENRLKVICLLQSGERCVCEIWQELKIPQNLASHHLKVLKNFNLLQSEKEGVKVIYRLNKKELDRYTHMLNHFLNPDQ